MNSFKQVTFLCRFLKFNSFFKKFIYLFLAALGLRCCARAFSSCGKQGLLFLQCVGFSLRWLLLLQSTGSRLMGFNSCGSQALECRLSSCGTQAEVLRGMWDLPRPGLKPVSPALAGRFLTTALPGKSLNFNSCIPHFLTDFFSWALVFVKVCKLSERCQEGISTWER